MPRPSRGRARRTRGRCRDRRGRARRPRRAAAARGPAWRVGAACGDQHLGARAGERADRLQAEAGVAAGDERAAPGEVDAGDDLVERCSRRRSPSRSSAVGCSSSSVGLAARSKSSCQRPVNGVLSGGCRRERRAGRACAAVGRRRAERDGRVRRAEPDRAALRRRRQAHRRAGCGVSPRRGAGPPLHATAGARGDRSRPRCLPALVGAPRRRAPVRAAGSVAADPRAVDRHAQLLQQPGRGPDDLALGLKPAAVAAPATRHRRPLARARRAQPARRRRPDRSATARARLRLHDRAAAAASASRARDLAEGATPTRSCCCTSRTSSATTRLRAGGRRRCRPRSATKLYRPARGGDGCTTLPLSLTPQGGASPRARRS